MERLQPEVIYNGKQGYFKCPKCNSVLFLDWDAQNHKVIYSDKCRCGQLLLWTKKLIDLSQKSPQMVSYYMKTGYFTKYKREE